jgi:hypothetical protein
MEFRLIARYLSPAMLAAMRHELVRNPSSSELTAAVEELDCIINLRVAEERRQRFPMLRRPT